MCLTKSKRHIPVIKPSATLCFLHIFGHHHAVISQQRAEQQFFRISRIKAFSLKKTAKYKTRCFPILHAGLIYSLTGEEGQRKAHKASAIHNIKNIINMSDFHVNTLGTNGFTDLLNEVTVSMENWDASYLWRWWEHIITHMGFDFLHQTWLC